MKKIVLILMAFLFCGGTNAFAQIDLFGVEENLTENSVQPEDNTSEKETLSDAPATAVDTPKQADVFAEFIEDIEAEKAAKAEAQEMLKQKPELLKLRPSQIKEMENNKIKRERVRQRFLDMEQEKMKPEEKVQNILEKYESAPLGLSWGISAEKMQEVGYELEPVEREGYPNSYVIKNAAEKNAKGYENVITTFGENNVLWCINAQTTAQKDDSAAKETLKLYQKYYDALKEKYGNAKEYFSPYTYETELSEKDGEEEVIRKIKKENPRGNPDFLKELQTGKAELFATFHNNTIGVTLSVYVDEKGLGQLVLDYKNLPLMKKEKEAFINNL